MENERDARLHQHLEELVRSQLGRLEKDISRLQREINESFTNLLEATDAASTLSPTDGVIEQINAEINARVDQVSAQSVQPSGDIALLRDSVTEMDAQRNQAEVLNALVSRAANFAPRVVLFVVKGNNAFAWAARGFDGPEGNNAIRGLSFPLQADTALRVALDAQQTFFDAPDQQAENQLLFSRLGNVKPERVLSVPLKVRQKSAALLYADSGQQGASALNFEAIELLVHSAGIVVELVSLRARMSEGAQPASKPTASEPVSQPVNTTSSLAEVKPAEPEPQPAPPVVSAPVQTLPAEPPAAPPVEAVGQPAPAGFEWQAAEPASQPAAVEEPSPVSVAEPPAPVYAYDTVPAESVPETLPPPVPEVNDYEASFAQPAQGFDFQVSPPATTTPTFDVVEPPQAPASAFVSSPSGMLGEAEKEHNAARRFARLLVSEIKLYNEHKVLEGRTSGDLYDRLKDDIDRSRQMYEKRISDVVAARCDYFYEELVNTLAEGNPNKLGATCPGPAVRV